MSLANAIIKTGATWAPTGGSDLTFVSDGRQISDGLSLVVAADTNLVLRRTLLARATLPTVPAKVGDYARLGRAALTYGIPFLAADGKLYKQTVKIEMAFHSEYASANKNVVIADSAAFIADADFLTFWQSLLLS